MFLFILDYIKLFKLSNQANKSNRIIKLINQIKLFIQIKSIS